MYRFGLVFVLLCLTFSAQADKFVITQKNLKFSNPLKVIHPGDQIVFTNKDNISHNIVSLTSGFQFDLGVLPSGASKAVTFKNSGVADIQCTIHPNMKMTLFVF